MNKTSTDANKANGWGNAGPILVDGLNDINKVIGDTATNNIEEVVDTTAQDLEEAIADMETLKLESEALLELFPAEVPAEND